MDSAFSDSRLRGLCSPTVPFCALVVALIVGLAPCSLAQNFTSGDLLIGFRDTEAAADINYLINLGQATAFKSLTAVTIFGTNGVESKDYGDDLRSIYGNSWFSNPSLSWSLYAQTGARANQYVSTTTGSTSDPGDAPVRRNPNSLGTPNSSYSTVGGTYYNSSLDQPFNGDPVANGTAVLAGGEWSQALTILGNFTKEAVISSGTPVLSLYEAAPSTIRDLPALHLGYFSINNLGLITYTPGSLTGGGGAGGGAYTGPWNWTAGSGNWDATNNWTNGQAASNGFAVGITGAGGTITNNAVTNLSSLTFSNSAGSYTLTGTNTGQTLTISGGITNLSSNTQTFDLSIAGAGGVTQSETGIIVLARSNSYNGGTTLNGGAVEIRNNNALGTGTVTVSGASSLIAGVANLSTTNAMALNAATTINTEANRWTNAGTLSGSGSLTKIGSGTLTIAGTGSTFSGNTALTTGALQIASGSTLGSGTVTVASGTTLSGSGTVGGVLVQSNGILTGGVDGAVGKLTVSGGLKFLAGGILNWKLGDASGLAGTGFDSFDVRGTLDLTGLTTGSTLQFNILNAVGGTTGFLNNQNSQWLVASANSITGFSTNVFTISTAGFTNALGGGAFGFITNATGLYLKFTALGVDPWTGNLASGSNVISGQMIASTNNAVIGANSSRNGSVAVTNNALWKVQGNLQVGGSTNGSGTLTIGSGGRIEANGMTISDQRGSRGLVLITNGASSDAITLGSGTLSFGAGNGTLQFAQSNAVTISNTIAGKGVISSTGTGTTTLTANNSRFSGTTSLSAGTMVMGTGAQLGGSVNVANRNATFQLASGSSLTSTNAVHAVAGKLVDNSGLAFTNAIRGTVALSGTGALEKSYAANSSVDGFGVGIGAGKRFSLLAGSVINAATLEAKITRGALDFKGTYSNNIVMAITDPSFSSIRNTIQWYDPATRTWKNTILGNISGSNKSAAIRGMNGTSFAGSFSTFLLQAKSVGILTAAEDTLAEINAMTGTQINTTLAKIMGAFGFDNRTKTSWAVINHNSLYSGEDLGSSEIFDEAALNHTLTDPGLAPLDLGASSVTTQAVPEPSTWALMILGGLTLLFVVRAKSRERI